MNEPENNGRRTLNSNEREKLRSSISSAVLNSVFSTDEHEEYSASNLRMNNAADIANK